MTKTNISVLAIDIGNTSITMAVATQEKVQKKKVFLTKKASKNQLAFYRNYEKLFSEIVICSVVPSETKRIKSILKSIYNKPILVLGQNILVPIKNCAKKPSQVGIDRLVNSVFAHHHFKKSVICIDFGTAITFDIVAKNGDYLGGVIAPGIELTLNALAENTALLPKIKLQHIQKVCGYDTVSSIRSGCSHGLGALCDGVVKKLSIELKNPHKVIATGGYAKFMSSYSKVIDVIDPDITLKGIALSRALSATH